MKRLYVAAAICLSGVVQASALTPREQAHDTLKHSGRVILIGAGQAPQSDSVRRMMDLFYVDQYRFASEPAAPYFMFMTRNTNLAMGIGGAIKVRGWYGWNGVIPGAAFSPYKIPMHPDPTQMRGIGATASGTMLFLKAMGRSDRLGTYSMYIEGEFSGYNDAGFKLNKAYATLNDWTLGLAPTTFSDPAALPPTVDAQGPNNKVDAAAVLVRWMHCWRDRWVMAASVENPAQLKVTDGGSDARLIHQWAPDLSVFLQYQWGYDNLQHVRLSATTREMSYRNEILGSNHHSVGWGVQLSSVFQPVSPLTVYATVNGGRGIASLGGDWMLNNYDMCPDPLRPGELYAPYVLGYMVGLQYHFSAKVSASTAWGQARYFPRHHAIGGDEYRYGVYGAANVFYNLTPRVQFGLGYNIGKRNNFDRASRVAHRLGLLAVMAF